MNDTIQLTPAFCDDGPTTSKLLLRNNLAFGIFNTFLAVATILLNSVTVAAYLKSRVLKGKLAYFMVMMLSANDLMVGLTSNVLFAAALLKEYKSERRDCLLNDMQIFLLFFFSGCSFKTLIVMSWERYAAICHPLYHRTKVTRKRLMKCLLFLWLVALSCGIFTWKFIAFFHYVIAPEVFILSVILMYFYARIYFANSKSSKNLIQASEGNSATGLKTARKDQRRQVMFNVNLAKSCFLAVMSFAVCYIPSCVVTNGAFKFKRDMGAAVAVWVQTLILTNSSINSIVFFWRTKSLREEAYAVVTKLLFIRARDTAAENALTNR